MKTYERQLDLGDSSWNIRPQQTDEEMAREIEKELQIRRGYSITNCNTGRVSLEQETTEKP